MRTMFRALIATLSDHRRQIGVFFFSTALLVGVFFLVPTLVHAAPGDGSIDTNGIGQDLGLLFGNICLRLTEIIGKLLLFVMDTFLVPIAGYNGFTTAPAVQHGWIILRDLTNMFFVLMMLVISIGTILGIEEFSYRRLLPRLLIMAVVINFSKVIVGIFIDFSQVVMLTFVNGFSAAAGGNMIALLRLKDTVDISEGLPGDKLDIWDFVGAQFLGLIMLFTALMIIVVMCMMLAFRIVMLWILTILSPLVFFLSTVQKGKAQQAYAQWWDKLGTYLVSGPVLAFFLWLAFSVAGGEGLTANFDTNGELSEVGKTQQYFVNAAGSRESLVGYIVGVAMLLGGMYITADFGAMGGSMLRSGADFVGKTAPRALGRFAYRNTAGRAIDLAGAGLERGKTGAEQLWFRNTGIYLPGSKRKEEFKKGLASRREQEASNAGLLVRRGRAYKSVQESQDNATSLDKTAAQAQGYTDSVVAKQRALMPKGAVDVRNRANRLHELVTPGDFVMDDQYRAALKAQIAGLSTDFEQANAMGDTAGKKRALEQMNELENMSAAKNGETVGWAANPKRAEIRSQLIGKAEALEADANRWERSVFESKEWQSLEQERQRLAGPLQQVNAQAEAARTAAQQARRDFAANPESRFLNAAVAKAQSEAMDGLSKNMNGTDRQNALRDAWDAGNGAAFQLLLDKIAQEEELPDILNDNVLGKKYGTDTAGLKAFADDIKQKFQLSQQETLRALSGAFGTASSKGQHVFRGRIGTDLASGAQRWNSDDKATLTQARKIDTISVNEFWKKDNTPAILTTNAAGTKTITDAGIYKLAATQEKFLELLQDNNVNQTVLQALKDNITQLRAMEAAKVLDKKTVDEIANATVKKVISAQEIAKQRAAKKA